MEKRKNLIFNGRKGQEEMVGFVLIIIVVSVILFFFLGLALQDKEASIESQEVENFIVSILPYTTDCKTRINNLSIQELILECVDQKECLDKGDNRKTCDVLNDTLKEILNVSWKVGDKNPNKAYKFKIFLNDEEMMGFEEGNVTSLYKGFAQYIPGRGSNLIDVIFRVYT